MEFQCDDYSNMSNFDVLLTHLPGTKLWFDLYHKNEVVDSTVHAYNLWSLFEKVFILKSYVVYIHGLCRCVLFLTRVRVYLPSSTQYMFAQFETLDQISVVLLSTML